MPFQSGQSGNPNGRPKKNRAWTEILERAGSVTEQVSDKRITRKKIIADMVMQAASTGEIIFPNERKLQAEFREWADFVKWIYTHIDGNAKQVLEHTGSSDSPMVVSVQYVNDWRIQNNDND